MLAKYIEKMQWRVRLAQLNDDSDDVPALFEELLVNISNFTMDELRRASAKLKTNKAAGVDEVPGEFWRLIFDDCLHQMSV